MTLGNFNSMNGNSMMGMMGMMNPMMTMGMMNSSSETGGNVFIHFKQKYGCEDCFQKTPVPTPCSIHLDPLPKEALKPSFWTILKRNILGG